MPPTNLQSSVNQIGETVTQIIHFSLGNKRTFSGIRTATIKQGEFTKMQMADGRMLLINPNNVDCIEVFPEDMQTEEEEEVNIPYGNQTN